jgi:predicted nucleic acid-binding protein
MIVVDTNVISYLFLASDRSTQAEKTLLRDLQWAVPLLWRGEFRSVLAQNLRRNLLSLQDAQQIMDGAINLMRGQGYEVPSLQAMHLVATSTCCTYSCEFVALAQDLGIKLITVGQQILSQFPSAAVSLDAFASPADSLAS